MLNRSQSLHSVVLCPSASGIRILLTRWLSLRHVETCPMAKHVKPHVEEAQCSVWITLSGVCIRDVAPVSYIHCARADHTKKRSANHNRRVFIDPHTKHPRILGHSPK